MGLSEPVEKSDILEELKNIDHEKTPPRTIEYFTDCWTVPIKPKLSNPIKLKKDQKNKIDKVTLMKKIVIYRIFIKASILL